jgi:hypothetical protein
LGNRDYRVHHIIISVFLAIFKCIVNGIVCVTILARRVVKFNGGEAPAVRFMEECLEGRVRLGGCLLPCVEFLEGEYVGRRKNANRVRNDLFV